MQGKLYRTIPEENYGIAIMMRNLALKIASTLIFGIVTIMTTCTYVSAGDIISHAPENKGKFDISKHRERLEKKETLTLPLSQTLELLEQLSEFELGRFLLANKGLNGYWTSYIILHGPKKESLTILEEWFLHSAPAVKATQERFKIFQQKLQSNLRDNISIASVPCGIMDDLVGLNTSKYTNVTFVGIDLDDESTELAKQNSKNNELAKYIFLKKDAWNLGIESEYDIITSNGLNIYEPNDEKVVDLYRNFYTALKPCGLLITSFLTPPPALSEESPWQNLNKEDLIKQKAIFADIIEAGWQCFQTEKETIDQLTQAGFIDINITYDTQHMFPTVTARKP